MARTLVALSGGVDSATAAALLAEAGEELVGVFMRNGVTAPEGRARSCCSMSDAADARAVADRLGMPFYVHDMQRSFDVLIEAFARDYAAGLTPNPCIVCNNDLKFGDLMQLADDLGCDGVATGHYARLEDGALRRAADPAKDQSYLLAGLTPAQLRRSRFPLGAMLKPEVRDHARRLGLKVADKPDSADICFVPGGDYRAVVHERLGDGGRAGEIVDADGRVLGRHEGVAGFTVGQRRGLGVALGRPAFVTAIDPDSGRVTIGDRDDLRRADCVVATPNWLTPPAGGDPGPEGRALPARVEVQLRHHHQAEPARLLRRGDDVEVRFDGPSQDVTPGQYAVFYSGDRVIGSGRIRRPGATAAPATEVAP